MGVYCHIKIENFSPPLKLVRNDSKMARYNVFWFVNSEETSSCLNVTDQQAYEMAIPGEALMPVEGNRWHVMMKNPALNKMEAMSIGDSFKVCWQEQHPQPGYDTEMICITRVS